MRKTNTTAIHVGVSKDSILAARQGILEILKVKECDEHTKRVALGTLSNLCSVSNTHISNCHINMSGE